MLRSLAIAALAFWPAVTLAGPAEPLLQHVSPHATICVVLQDLRTHLKTVGESPFAAWFPESTLGKQLLGRGEIKKILEVDKLLRDQFGVPASAIVDEILGDAVVFAYQPGPPEKPQDEAGLILVKPRKPALLLQLIGKMDELQKTSGELRGTQAVMHRNRSYTAREKVAGGSEFYFVHDGIFAFSGQESAIRSLIDRTLASPSAPNFRPHVAAGLRRLGVQDKAAVLWVNPRGFDLAVGAKAEAATDAKDKAFLTQFRKLWSAVDGVAVYAHPDHGLDVGVVVGVRRGEVPAELAAVWPASTEGSAALAAVPANALVSVGGRVDLAKLTGAVGSFLPGEGEGKTTLQAVLEKNLGPVFGRDRLPTVLRGIGPDWASFVLPPDDGNWQPRGGVAIRVSADVTPAMSNALSLGFQLIRLAYNQSHTEQLDVAEQKQADVAVKVLTGLPDGVHPCFAVKSGYLIVASSPSVIAEFSPKAETTAAPRLRVLTGRLREYLTRHREPIAKSLAAAHGKTADEVTKELTRLMAVLELFDRVEITPSTDDDRIKLNVRFEFSKRLAK